MSDADAPTEGPSFTPKGDAVYWSDGVVACLTPRGWWATMTAPSAIRAAIFRMPNDTPAPELARRANIIAQEDRANG